MIACDKGFRQMEEFMENKRRRNKKGLVWIIAAFILLLIPIFGLVGGFNRDAESVHAFGDSAVSRISFIKSFGWEVSPDLPETAEITIPSKFNEVYKNYNSLQKSQGFDLKKYRGKAAVRYTYKIVNYPSESGEFAENVVINLIVCEGKIIGGDVCSLELDGFMRGFEKP